MRLIIPIVLFLIAFIYIIYLFLIKKDNKAGLNMLGVTAFFGVVWSIIFYMFLS